MIAALYGMGFHTGFYGVTGRADAESLRLPELGPRENLRVREVEIPTGRCLALINRDDPHRDRALVILPNANDLAGSEPPDMAYFDASQWVHLTSFVSRAPLEAQIDLVERLGGRVQVSFDPGAIYVSHGWEELEPILRRTDLLFVTEEELEALTDHQETQGAVARLLDLGVALIVLKRGERGIAAFDQAGSYHQPAIDPRRIIDRTGAGDVAAAGFLGGMIRGLGIEESLKVAAAAASRSIEGYGRAAYPDQRFFEQVAFPRT